jgi:hypothetical protein
MLTLTEEQHDWTTRFCGIQTRTPTGKLGSDGNITAGSSPATTARLAWSATRKKIESDAKRLHGTLATAIKGHDQEDELNEVFRTQVDAILDMLDEELTERLNDIDTVTDADVRFKLVAEAQKTIEGYQKRISTHPAVALLDDNPFTPMAIQKTVSASLNIISLALLPTASA